MQINAYHQMRSLETSCAQHRWENRRRLLGFPFPLLAPFYLSRSLFGCWAPPSWCCLGHWPPLDTLKHSGTSELKVLSVLDNLALSQFTLALGFTRNMLKLTNLLSGILREQLSLLMATVLNKLNRNLNNVNTTLEVGLIEGRIMWREGGKETKEER